MKPLKMAIGIGLLGTVTLAPTSSPASCPAPTVFLTKASARPGETVVVKGRYGSLVARMLGTADAPAVITVQKRDH